MASRLVSGCHLFMKPFRKRYLRHIFLLLLGGGVLTIAYIFLVSHIENIVEAKLVDIHGKSKSIEVDLLTRSVYLEKPEILPSREIPLGIQLNFLEVKGIQLYALLVHETFAINTIRADSGKILYNKAIEKIRNDTIPQKARSFTVQNLLLTNLICEIRTDTLIDFSSSVDFEATGVEINLSNLSYKLKSLKLNSRENNFSRSSGMYGMTIDQLRYSSEDQKIIVDSFLLIPNYGKYEFGRQKGEQVGRINVSVPKLVIEGIAVDEIIDTAFTASKIQITSFDLHSFKDKRVPFLRTKHILLPMECFQQLPYPIAADTIIITDSRVTIEEIPETGTESGSVTIDHINAACGLITNRYHQRVPKYAALKASGLIMNQGEIKAVFSLPLDGSPTYFTTGSISDFPFEKLNPALENLAWFKIESGKLNNMKFNFRYTDLLSTGTMEIDYEDLRIIGLKKNTDDESDIKTFVINTIVKNSKNGEVDKLKRTGTINIERDRRRYIFNIWWKSLLDGLGSSILGIEKNPTRKK